MTAGRNHQLSVPSALLNFDWTSCPSNNPQTELSCFKTASWFLSEDDAVDRLSVLNSERCFSENVLLDQNINLAPGSGSAERFFLLKVSCSSPLSPCACSVSV